MTSRLFCSLKPSCVIRLNNFTKVNNCVTFTNAAQNIRNLYSLSTLGIDGFLSQKEKTERQMENISEKFKEKMMEYSQDDAKNMIFTEDLKNMIHISKNDEDILLVVKMIKKFNQQNKQLRFGNYIFGPVFMRLLHHYNKPDIALECFKAPELNGFFDQLISYQILLDMLYENKRYDDMFEAFQLIKEKQLEGSKYPRNIVVLVLAACYKQNSKESLEYALNLWQELKEIGHFPMRRATTYCAGLALNQDKPNITMEVLTLTKNQNYTTVRNLKAAALADLNRPEDAMVILKSILLEDVPGNTNHTFNKDVLERVKNAVDKCDSQDVKHEYQRIRELFEKQGHISDITLDEQLCQEIQKPPMLNNRQQQNRRDFRQPPQNRNYKFRTFNQRPGLGELV